MITVQNKLENGISMARRSDHTREQLHRMALSVARAIVAKEGLRGLSTRRIARKLGYSPGTLYQLFTDLDDLIVQLNTMTLESLFNACDGINLTGDPETALDELAERYIQFVHAHPQLWNALFEHSLPSGKAVSDRYSAQVERLLGLAAIALGPVTPDKTAEAHEQDALVLWASLYGIASLANANKLGPLVDPIKLVKKLVAYYVAGLRQRTAQTSMSGRDEI